MEELVRTYQDRLFGYALRLLHNRFDAQDVTQDVFLRAYRSLAFKYDEEKCRNLDLKPWLFRITRNLAFNRLRSRRSKPWESLAEDGSGGTPVSRSVSNPGLHSLEEQTLLESALGLLDPVSRDLVLLRFVEGMAYAEIAAVTGTSEASSRGKVFRALRKLRAILKEDT